MIQRRKDTKIDLPDLNISFTSAVRYAGSIRSHTLMTIFAKNPRRTPDALNNPRLVARNCLHCPVINSSIIRINVTPMRRAVKISVITRAGMKKFVARLSGNGSFGMNRLGVRSKTRKISRSAQRKFTIVRIEVDGILVPNGSFTVGVVIP